VLAATSCTFKFDRALEPGELRGRLLVESAEGTTTPASNAQVNIVGSQLTAKSDAGGRFVFRGLGAANYTLRVLRDAEGTGQPINAIQIEHIVIDSVSGKPGARDLGDVIIAALGGVQGTVKKAGAALPGARVIVRNVDQQEVTAAGNYSFIQLPPGAYQLYLL